MKAKSISISSLLQEWYKINKRDLPWRNTRDAYKIWISEIILQQTRVAQGLPYYFAFIEQFPTVDVLASSDQQEVLRCWQGLGYYSRARNMQFTAKLVVDQFDSIFPTTYGELISLKGVGPYTAAAVASFSSNEDVAVLDDNVMRVLSRLFGIEKDIAEEKTKKELQLLANEVLPKGNSATHNQAMMELGALICLPKNPNCQECPLIDKCEAYSKNQVDVLPIKRKKTKARPRYFNYLVIRTPDNQFYMKERHNSDIWAGLWDFPLVETEESIDSVFELRMEELTSTKLTFANMVIEPKHQLSHQTIWAKFWVFDLQEDECIFFGKQSMVPIGIDQIGKLPKPVLINNFLKKYIFL